MAITSLKDQCSNRVPAVADYI